MLCIYYCAPDMEYIDEATQIKIDYNPKDDSLEKFLDINQNKTIYIQINLPDLFKHEEYLRQLQDLKKYNNWILQIPLSYLRNTEGEFDNNKFNAIKDCCNKYMFTDMIGNWEVLQYILSLQPAEVYLTNILGFCIEDAKKVCDKYGVGIRLFANFAQSSWDGIPDVKKFFIRPEDITEYYPFVSGIEFKGGKQIQEVCYKVYSRQYWYGNLSEIIIGINDSLDSRRLPEYFGNLRVNCKKRCITGGSCNICHTMREFMERMEKTDTMIIPKVKR